MEGDENVWHPAPPPRDTRVATQVPLGDLGSVSLCIAGRVASFGTPEALSCASMFRKLPLRSNNKILRAACKLQRLLARNTAAAPMSVVSHWKTSCCLPLHCLDPTHLCKAGLRRTRLLDPLTHQMDAVLFGRSCFVNQRTRNCITIRQPTAGSGGPRRSWITCTCITPSQETQELAPKSLWVTWVVLRCALLKCVHSCSRHPLDLLIMFGESSPADRHQLRATAVGGRQGDQRGAAR